MSVSPDALAQSGWVRRADAALGAWLARAFPAAAPAVALAATLAARAVGDGHSALDLTEAGSWFARLDSRGKPPALPEPAAWREALARSPAVHVHRDGTPLAPVPLVLDARQRVYLRRYFEYECRVARQLAALTAGAMADPGGQARAPGRGGLDAEQQRAVTTALARRLTLITGGPGSGKTFSVAHILAALAGRGHTRIALAAPTGKAATRLAESLRAQLARMALPDAMADMLPRDASTLHRLLGISPWRSRPRHHRDAPLPFDVVVVDEASMVDLPLMARLTDALAPDARLILLGDPDQLSAVEAGNVLPALVEAASGMPFAGCHVALAGSHRFVAGSALGRLARAVVDRDTDAALAALQAEDEDLRLVAGTDRAMLVEDAHAGYRAVTAAANATAALEAARGFRVLTALRHGPAGCAVLNRAIEARIKRAHGIYVDAEWWRGRLVMVTANRDEVGLYNGDTGVVWPDADGALKVWFDGAASPRAFAPAALPPHEGAFALTVHKAQGSEFARVTLVTGPDSPVLTRELLYTGITRARSGITVYSTADTLRTGIGRRTLRMTGLADRLREAAAASVSIAESLPNGE
ncbi:MAG TPA: exodeoxyribonuclease V subunit alpha [Rhodanobacteraceae bacterium]|nr:exodeoxyribonuclease V subunit alpha [Rhodanobacteraceae bacterium]